MLLLFRDKLSADHLHSIIKACIENGQINYSFGARSKLRGLLKESTALMSPEEKAKITELMKVKLDE